VNVSIVFWREGTIKFEPDPITRIPSGAKATAVTGFGVSSAAICDGGVAVVGILRCEMEADHVTLNNAKHRDLKSNRQRLSLVGKCSHQPEMLLRI
jgi:hypothetical protein